MFALVIAAITAWGFPLGVSQDELKAAVGEPKQQTTRKASTMLAMVPGMNTEYTTWTYERNGQSYYISFRDGKTSGVSISSAVGFAQPLTASDPAPLPADEFGIRLGDQMGKILLKTHSVTGIDPNNALTVTMAMFNVRRGDLNYQFQINQDRLDHESVYLISP